MQLVVEGGGFFSYLASGYSKGLMLLLLKETPIRVSPLRYQLVEQEAHPDIQLASRKKQISCRCASFLCFGHSSAGADGPSPPKVGPVHHSETLTDSSYASDGDEDCTTNITVNTSARKLCLKSSLKKPPTNCSVAVGEGDLVHGPVGVQNNTSGCTEKRKVHWTDACGGELVDIREFEQSDEDPSDDESDSEDFRKCKCVIQ